MWGGSELQTVHAVEKAAPMLALGFACQKALRAGDAAIPSVRWSRKLAPDYSDNRAASQQ